MSRDGHVLAIRQNTPRGLSPDFGLLRLADGRRTELRVEGLADFVCVGNVLVTVANGSVSIFRQSGERAGTASLDGPGDGALIPAAGPNASAAIWVEDDRSVLITWRSHDGEGCEAVEFDVAGDLVGSLNGQRIVVAQERTVSVMDVGGTLLSRAALPGTGQASDFTSFLGGRASAFVTHTDEGTVIDVLRAKGGLVHHIELPPVTQIAFAEAAGVAVGIVEPNSWVMVDLQHNDDLGRFRVPIDPVDITVDAHARSIVVAGFQPGQDRLSVLHVPTADLGLGDPASRARTVERTEADGPRADTRTRRRSPARSTPSPEPASPGREYTETTLPDVPYTMPKRADASAAGNRTAQPRADEEEYVALPDVPYTMKRLADTHHDD